MKKIIAMACTVVMFFSIPVFAADPDVDQQLTAAGLTVNWLTLDGKYLDFYPYDNRDGYYTVQVTDQGEYVNNRWGTPVFIMSGGFGRVDPEGKVAVPFLYDYVGDFQEGLAVVNKESVSAQGIDSTVAGAVNAQGEVVIPLKYGHLRSFSEGLAAAQTATTELSTADIGTGSEGGLYGYIDKTGEWIIPPQFSNANDFSNGVAIVSIVESDETSYRTLNALINKEGKLLTSFESYWWISDTNDGYYIVQNKDERCGVIDQHGQEIVPFQYDYISYAKNGNFIVATGGYDRKHGMIDRQGNILIPIAYDVLEFQDRALLIRGVNGYGDGDDYREETTYFDEQGQVVISKADYRGFDFYHSITGFYANDPLNPNVESYMDYRNGLIDQQGNVILPPKYRQIFSLADDRAAVKFGEFFALFDAQGNQLTAFIYDTLDEFKDGYSIFRQGDGYGLLNKQGVEVVPAIFAAVSPVVNGKIMVGLGEEAVGGYSRIGILSLTEEMAERTTVTPNFIQATLDGNVIAFDQTPIMLEGRTLVPMRAIFEEFGAEVKWDHTSQTVTANGVTADGEKVEVILTINGTDAYVNGKSETLDVPASLIGGRTFVPLRFVAESLDMEVEWVEAQQLIVITTRSTGSKRTADTI